MPTIPKDQEEFNDRIIHLVRKMVGHLEGTHTAGHVRFNLSWSGSFLHVNIHLVNPELGTLLIYDNGLWPEGEDWKGYIESLLPSLERVAQEMVEYREAVRRLPWEREEQERKERSQRFRELLLGEAVIA